MATDLPNTQQSLSLTRFHGGKKGTCLQLTMPWSDANKLDGKGFVHTPYADIPALIEDLQAALKTSDSDPIPAPPPATRWVALREHMLRNIAEIDAATPWAEVEPGWWLDMMKAERLLRGM